MKSETENSWHSLCMDRSPRVVEYVEIWLNSPFNQHVAQRRGLLVLCFTIILGFVWDGIFSCPLSLQLLKLNLIYTYCTTHLFINNITYTLSSWKSVFFFLSFCHPVLVAAVALCMFSSVCACVCVSACAMCLQCTLLLPLGAVLWDKFKLQSNMLVSSSVTAVKQKYRT